MQPQVRPYDLTQGAGIVVRWQSNGGISGREKQSRSMVRPNLAGNDWTANEDEFVIVEKGMRNQYPTVGLLRNIEDAAVGWHFRKNLFIPGSFRLKRLGDEQCDHDAERSTGTRKGDSAVLCSFAELVDVDGKATDQ